MNNKLLVCATAMMALACSTVTLCSRVCSDPRQPSRSAKETVLAKTFVMNFVKGDDTATSSEMSPRLCKFMPIHDRQNLRASAVMYAGRFVRIIHADLSPSMGFNSVTVLCQFQHRKVAASVVFDATDKVSGFELRPPHETTANGTSRNNSARIAKAKSFVKYFLDGNQVEFAAAMDPTMRTFMRTQPTVKVRAAILKQGGTFRKFGSPSESNNLGFETVTVPCVFQKQTVLANVAFDQDNNVAAFTLTQPTQP